MNVMRIIQLIEQRMFPIRIRFGIGIGSITTDIDANMAIGADGPGYYKARDAIEYLKKQEKKRMISSSDVRFEVDSDNQGTTILLNTIADLMFTIKSSWSKRQRQVIWDLLIHQDSQKEVANRLKIAQPTVNKILTAGNYYVYKQALDTIGMVMDVFVAVFHMIIVSWSTAILVLHKPANTMIQKILKEYKPYRRGLI